MTGEKTDPNDLRSVSVSREVGQPAPHIEATVRFLRTDEGGRSHPAYSGYRPQFYYDGHDWDGEHVFLGVAEANPGDMVTTRITLGSPESHTGKIHPGMGFELREGTRVVATGIVTRLLNLGRGFSGSPGCPEYEEPDPVQQYCRARGYAGRVVQGGLEELLASWQATVSCLARGNDQDIYEYLIGMHGRQILDEVLAVADESTRAKCARLITQLDDRFRGLTSPSAHCIWGKKGSAEQRGWTAERNWWYFRKPTGKPADWSLDSV